MSTALEPTVSIASYFLTCAKRAEACSAGVGSSSTRGGVPPYLGPYFAAKATMHAPAVCYAGELSGASKPPLLCQELIPRGPAIPLMLLRPMMWEEAFPRARWHRS